MNLKKAISLLMRNDKNGTWYEVTTITELKEALTESLNNYEPQEESYQFYLNILESVTE